MTVKTIKEQLIEKVVYLVFTTAVLAVTILTISSLSLIRKNQFQEINNFAYDLFLTTANYTIPLLALTIIAYLILEISTKKKISYIQYTLIGLSVSVNLLLNLSLGEFISFIPAFLISATMTILLNTLFTGLISKNFSNPIIIFSSLVTFYGGLFFFIQSTDYNLLIVSILSFIAVSIAMIISTLFKTKETI